MRFLVDECLHTSLVDVLSQAGHLAQHVAHCGMSGWKDHSIMRVVMQEELILVTNNAADFRRLHGREDLHPGLIIILPNVPPDMQRRLMSAVLRHVADRGDLINTVVEISLAGGCACIDEYALPG